MKEIVFISNNWHDTHQQLRLGAISEFEVDIKSLGLERNHQPTTSHFQHTSLGCIQNKRYFQRLICYTRLLALLPKATCSADFVYVFGFDLFLVTLFYRLLNKSQFKIVHEITDIRELFFSTTLMGRLVRWLEKLSIPKTDLLVVTSEEYVNDYLRKQRKVPISNYLVIENKIHVAQHPITTEPIPLLGKKSKIRIGYFGYLRCPTSLECLFHLADSYLFEIVLAGTLTESTKGYEQQLSQHPSITFLSGYDGNRDAAHLYSQIDFTWAVYPFSLKKTGNHQWARTNRFYESLFFRKPPIVQKGTADAHRAKVLGAIAVEIDLTKGEQVVQSICNYLNHDTYDRLCSKITNLSSEHYLITNEYYNLARCLNLIKR